MYAIIRTGGKQYRVEQGQTIYIEQLSAPVGEKVTLGEVLLLGSDGGIRVGTPLVNAASVSGTVVEQGRDRRCVPTAVATLPGAW